MKKSPFALLAVALVGLTGCFPDPSTEPPASTTTTTTEATTTTVAPTTTTTTTTTSTTTTTIAGSPGLVGVFDVSTMQPEYGDTFTVTMNLANVGTADATGVSVDLAIPDGLSFVSGPAAYDGPSHTWTIGTLADGTDTTIALTLRAGDVALGERYLLLTSSSDNAPPAQAMIRIVPVKAPVTLSIVADPANPSPLDISSPDSASWTAHVLDADHPSNPAPSATVSWTCETASQNPCPLIPALITPGIATVTFYVPSLGLDGYLLTAYASVNDPNYESSPAPATVGFVTTDAGG